jgi:hypothetical protein
MFLIAFVFAAAAIPFIFFFLDLITRVSLKFTKDDLGPDLILIGVSLCIARVFEATDALVRTNLDVKGKEYYGGTIILFSLLLLIGLIFWIGTMAIIKYKVGENWKIVGGDDLPLILSIIIGLIVSIIYAAIYTVNRINL